MMDTATKNLRAAIIGFGRNGYMHGAPMKELPGIELVAICDIDEKRRETAEKDYGAAFYTDFREMIEKEKPELVSIISRNDQHLSMAIECMELGCSVLVTKPWALTAKEAETLIAVSRKTGKHLLPWLPSRWSKAAARLKSHIQQGLIGDVFHVRRTVTCFHKRSDWQTQKEFGGGYLLNWGAHIVEPPFWILGQRVKKVSAFMKQVVNPGDTEDVFSAQLTLENGAQVTAEHTFSALPLPHWIVQGTRGTIQVHNKEEQLIRMDPLEPEVKGDFIRFPVTTTLQQQPDDVDYLYGKPNDVYADVIRVLRGETVAGFDLDAALHLSYVIDAIRTSAESGETVTL